MSLVVLLSGRVSSGVQRPSVQGLAVVLLASLCTDAWHLALKGQEIASRLRKAPNRPWEDVGHARTQLTTLKGYAPSDLKLLQSLY